MLVDVTDAAERLDELIELVEAGEDVILTLDGRQAVRLALVPTTMDLAAGKAEG